ncbi:hypothetical protein [Roseibium salinum]|uniref:Uncharacterized protein n=1 Tax=Roseibium salinum TaxID=1604349 RepID=A0ABT3R1T5_9HYPH|nr:hypothetical protein [Roseibium sp. DSM 29163]MCX2723050.1 hypothetical protein [Roseibium sp. DSM 29163]MDN3719010.1 hypothetical protein [Roseibium salinum]
MRKSSKVIPFPIPLKRSSRFSSTAFPRFAIAFGDREPAPAAITDKPRPAPVLFNAPEISPCP